MTMFRMPPLSEQSLMYRFPVTLFDYVPADLFWPKTITAMRTTMGAQDWITSGGIRTRITSSASHIVIEMIRITDF